MVCFFGLQEEPGQKEVLTWLLWLAPTGSLPGAHIPQACNLTPVLLPANRAQTELAVRAEPPPAPALQRLCTLSPMIANPDKPEPENTFPPRILILGQENI